MATDAETKAFLDLTDGDIAGWAQDRAEALGLILPEATLPAVHENLALLRTQTALFIAALGDQAAEPPAAAFEP